jgi:hypothetical protein
MPDVSSVIVCRAPAEHVQQRARQTALAARGATHVGLNLRAGQRGDGQVAPHWRGAAGTAERPDAPSVDALSGRPRFREPMAGLVVASARAAGANWEGAPTGRVRSPSGNSSLR